MKLPKVALLLLFAVVLAIATAIPPAMADDGPGTFAVEGTEPLSTSEVRYVVRLTFIGDGHPARDATVTATAIGADGAAQTPVPMTVADQDGRYEATIAFPAPGEWTVRFTSVLPPATLDQLQTVAAPSTTTSEPTTTTSIAAPTSTEPADDEVAAEDDDGGGFPWLVPVVGLGAIVAAGSWLVARRRRP